MSIASLSHKYRGIRALCLLAFSTGCASAISPVVYRLPGRIAQPITKDGSTRFAGLFCHALDPSWGPCGDYLEEARPQGVGLLGDAENIRKNSAAALDLGGARVLLVGGLFSDCLAKLGVSMFQDAARELRLAGVTVDTVPPLADVADFIWDHPGEPYIAIGYSKGAGDIMDALTTYPDLPIGAFVTVAGSVGGSRLADQMPGAMPALPGCDASGLAQLTRANRHAALQRYHSAVPAFSLVAVADGSRVSAVLRPSWDFLRTFSADNDSQVIAEEGIVPGATYLGVARADHWAIALPFDEVSDPQTRLALAKLVDKNLFPRAALLRAIVQFVVGEATR